MFKLLTKDRMAVNSPDVEPIRRCRARSSISSVIFLAGKAPYGYWLIVANHSMAYTTTVDCHRYQL
jgi:hypothetical protein